LNSSLRCRASAKVILSGIPVCFVWPLALVLTFIGISLPFKSRSKLTCETQEAGLLAGKTPSLAQTHRSTLRGSTKLGDDKQHTVSKLPVRSCLIDGSPLPAALVYRRVVSQFEIFRQRKAVVARKRRGSLCHQKVLQAKYESAHEGGAFAYMLACHRLHGYVYVSGKH
jgi:hypothetical protein